MNQLMKSLLTISISSLAQNTIASVPPQPIGNGTAVDSGWATSKSVCIEQQMGYCDSNDSRVRCQEATQAIMLASNDKVVFQATCTTPTFEQWQCSCGPSAQLLTIKVKIIQ